MIITEKTSWLRMIFAIHGTTAGKIWPRVAVVFIFSVVITTISVVYPIHAYSLTTAPFTVIGLALAIFLGFRNSAAYDRYWEGRKLWGRMVNVCRSFTMQILTLIDGPEADARETDDREYDAKSASPDVETIRHEMVLSLIAYINAFRHRLRDSNPADELRHDLPDGDPADVYLSHENVPAAVANGIAQQINRAWRNGWLNVYHVPLLHTNLTEMLSIQGGCERIKSTPIPFTYSVLTHRTVLLYCLALPCGLHDTVGILTPVVVGLVAYAFLGLDAVGDEVEQPFGLDANQLPLHQLTRMIEINLRQMSGHDPSLIPPPIEAVNETLH